MKQKSQKIKRKDQVKEIQDQAKNIKYEVLQAAAFQLKQAFRRSSKSLFSPRISPPYFRSEESRPLHFTKDGLHLMYFSETEFIKLDLKTSQIVLRRKLPRADLSPIFIDYKIWSQDDSKVLVFKQRTFKPEKLPEIYVYNVSTGKYANLGKKLYKKFGPTPIDPLLEILIECFHPSNTLQIIIKIENFDFTSDENEKNSQTLLLELHKEHVQEI